MFWWKPYEPILEAKAVPAREVLLDLLADELAELCATFPPEESAVDWQDEGLRRRYAGRLAELPRPDQDMVAELARVLELDLEREFEALDHYFRNGSFGDRCPTPLHIDALQLLWRAGAELLLCRQEEGQGHIKRKELVEAARRLPGRYRRKYGLSIV
ncbi:MAG: hypothetical protein ACO3JL_09570 [Myxococcota bacterium]